MWKECYQISLVLSGCCGSRVVAEVMRENLYAAFDPYTRKNLTTCQQIKMCSQQACSKLVNKTCSQHACSKRVNKL